MLIDSNFDSSITNNGAKDRKIIDLARKKPKFIELGCEIFRELEVNDLGFGGGIRNEQESVSSINARVEEFFLNNKERTEILLKRFRNALHRRKYIIKDFGIKIVEEERGVEMECFLLGGVSSTACEGKGLGEIGLGFGGK